MFLLLLKAFFASVFAVALYNVIKPLVRQRGLRKIAGPPSVSWLTGNLTQIFNPLISIPFQLEVVKDFGRIFRIHGWFGDKWIYVTDPLALQHMLLKDQHIFEETSMFIETNKMIFGRGLLSTMGDTHKKQRKMMNPVFSPAHMRHIHPIFTKITHQLLDAISRNLKEHGELQELNVLEWMSRAALEYIGQAGLGCSFEDFESSDANPYTEAIKDLFPSMWSLNLYRQLLPPFLQVSTPRIRQFLADHVPWDAFQTCKSVAGVMDEMSRKVFQEKLDALAQGDRAVEEQVGEGKDILSILIKNNMAASEEDRLPEEEVLGQMNTLIFAAHDSTSSTLSRILHLLCLHPHAQEILRKEATDAIAEHGDLNFDQLQTLPYLDAVVRETLRMYAPVTSVMRTARQDTILPFSKPVVTADGKTEISELLIPNNTNVVIGIAAANRDPDVWGDDAAEWKPERWLGKTPEEVTRERLPGVYSGMMTFINGSRACIGFKFSVLEMKVVLHMIIERFAFQLPENDEIIWRNTTLAKPVTKGREFESPHMPLKVSFARK